MSDRLGIGAGETGEQSFAVERLQALIVREELIDAVADALPGSEHDVHVLRAYALELLEQIGVEAQLDEEVGLGVSRELGVQDLVAERAEGGGGPLYALEEVGEAAPVAVNECGLVDDIGPAEHRMAGRLGRRVQARQAAPGIGNLDDIQALRPQRGQMRRLVLVALSGHKVNGL